MVLEEAKLLDVALKEELLLVFMEVKAAYPKSWEFIQYLYPNLAKEKQTRLS